MLMMRLQRVGRKNDPSFRIVVTDKRTSVKSDKHVDRLGSYNPKSKNFQLDVEKAKEWLAKGVQPSDTMHNLLISQKVIEGKKINVLPKKTPIVSEEATKEAVAKTETEESATEVVAAPTEEVAEETPQAEETADTEEVAETPAENDDAPVEAEAEKAAA